MISDAFKKVGHALSLVAMIVLTFLATPLVAGTCSGGPDGGFSCVFNSQCRSWCQGGPHNHSVCAFNANCGMTCAGGSRAGSSCAVTAQCPGSFCQQWYCTAFYCSGFLQAAAEGQDRLAAACDDLPRTGR
jgi:hypothetical protein